MDTQMCVLEMQKVLFNKKKLKIEFSLHQYIKIIK
jgi:hypothetical protein